MSAKKIKIFCYYISIGIVSAFLISRLYYTLTDDLRVSNMHGEVSFDPKWEISLNSTEKENIKEILNQKFTYLGKGAQCYAFASADDRYVIKFFKFKHLNPNPYLSWLPFTKLKQEQIERRKRRKRNIFSAYRIAYDHRDNFGMVYVHLNPTEDLKQHLVIEDKLGFDHTIDLDKTIFLLQKKGLTLRDHFNLLLSQGNMDQIKNDLNKIFDMYISEYLSGYYDRDHGVMQNTGFIGQEPFHLDAGKFSLDPNIVFKNIYKKDFQFVSWKISEWFRKNAPSHYSEMARFIEQQYYERIGENFTLKNFEPV